MDKKAVIQSLTILNNNEPKDCSEDILQLLECNVRKICECYDIEYDEITTLSTIFNEIKQYEDSPITKYLLLSHYFCEQLRLQLNDDLLSIQDIKILRHTFKNYVYIGICNNLNENMPQYKKNRSSSYNEGILILNQYYRLSISVLSISHLLQCDTLKPLILCDNYQSYLSAVYQLCHCPLKKPTNVVETENNFKMTTEIYDLIIKERLLFKKCLNQLCNTSNKGLYAKETMLLLEEAKALWLKKAVSSNLTLLLKSDGGLETIAKALIEYSSDFDPNDSSKLWKPVDILVRLILSLQSTDDFESNICKQVQNLLKIEPQNSVIAGPFLNIFVAVLKALYVVDQKSKAVQLLFDSVLDILTSNKSIEMPCNITDDCNIAISVIHIAVTGDNGDNIDFEQKLLSNMFYPLFWLYKELRHSKLIYMTTKLKEILTHHIDSTNFECFNDILFKTENNEYLLGRCDIQLSITEDDILLLPKNKSDETLLSNFDVINFLKCVDIKLLIKFLIKLLNLMNKPTTFNELEDISTVQHKMILFSLLSLICEDNDVISYILEEPYDIIDYFIKTFEEMHEFKCLQNLLSNTLQYQIIFTNLTLLHSLLLHNSKMDKFECLSPVLNKLLQETNDAELKQILKNILMTLSNKNVFDKARKKLSPVDAVIDEIYDPLIPIRGHGLLILTKLIEEKHPDILERKIYIFSLIQQQLKDTDSYIYLSAINALVALSEIMPGIVLDVVIDEYINFEQKSFVDDKCELRMKLGEVLIKIIKKLGPENVTQHKAILLNCFLTGIKDNDHLMRASAFSNLGAVCKILGLKLGPIVKEVLDCFKAAIIEDPAIEVRRAAVIVLRDLFEGLQEESILFLQDHIRDLYRTLKDIYKNDKDDVTRLHAQLALEQLNDNVVKFLQNPQMLGLQNLKI